MALCPKTACEAAFYLENIRKRVPDVMNPLHPRHLTRRERLDELHALLALGLIRLRARQSSELSAPGGESSLHIPPGRSGHANREKRRKA